MKKSKLTNPIFKTTVGRSFATPIKQEHLKSFFNAQMYKTKCIFRKHKWIGNPPIYHLFDITAGDAKSPDTSPIIFLNNLYSSKTLNFQALFIEKSKKEFNKLEQNIFNYIEQIPIYEEQNYFIDHIQLINKDSKEALSEYYNKKNEWAYGLLYCDFNGFKLNLWNPIIKFSKTWNALDIIINISPIQIKRNLGIQLPSFKKYNKNLLQLITQINKDKIYIRNNIIIDTAGVPIKNQFQHIMLFCTNFGSYKFIEKEYGFCLIDSEKGKQIIESHM